MLTALPQAGPDHKWAYFGNTLVYAFTKPERSEHCVVFFDKQSGNKLVKYVKKLLMIRACGEYCVLATKTVHLLLLYYSQA